MFWKSSTLFLVRDENGRPRDAYAGFFEPFTAEVPSGWRFQLDRGSAVVLDEAGFAPPIATLGPKELIEDYGFLDRLLTEYDPLTLAKFEEWIEAAESSPV